MDVVVQLFVRNVKEKMELKEMEQQHVPNVYQQLGILKILA